MTATLLDAPTGARPVRAPRGNTLSCKGWQQEAALRMLMNNLDPDVAERPDDLVVYGGTGKAARNWECFDAIVRALRALENDETLLVQSGKPVAVFRTHAQRAARADCQQQPRGPLGDVGRVPRARAQGPHDVRPDDGRLVDLHRVAGHRAGHVRDLRRGRAASTSAASLAGQVRAHAPDSAAWAARSHSPRRCTAPPSSAWRSTGAHREARRHRLLRSQTRSLDEALAWIDAARAVEDRRCRWASWAMRPRCFRSS